MSVYSTMGITREDAMKLIFNKVANLTNSEIEEVLFSLFSQKTLNNFDIVHEYEETDEYGYPIQYQGNEWKFE